MITVIYFWRIGINSLPKALLHMAIDRVSLKRNPNIKFYKSLGTGKGETFTPKDADASRWGLLVTLDKSELATFHNSKLINSWRKIARSEYMAELQPLSSHGKWSKLEPFEIEEETKWFGPVAAITRARIKFQFNLKFINSVPPVVASLKQASGLISAIGIGESPIGLQGTFSRWESSQSLKNFAYQGKAHQRAILQTEEYKWYSEELFARFAIIKEHGEF